MAYLDPASNPGSKPQSFSVKNCKSSTPDKLQTIKTFLGISCKLLTIMRKNFLFSNATAATLEGNFNQKNHSTFQENKNKINDLR